MFSKPQTLLFALLFLLSNTLGYTAAQDDTISRIAFGSCAQERQDQPVWEDIIATEPDLFLMIGDNHYADKQLIDGKLRMTPVVNVNRLREAYATLGDKEGFVALREACPIMATWDDHDYGANDKGNDFKLRKQSQQEFIRFFGFADDHPIREQEGIYHSRIFGKEGQRVQVIMLDTRYHRDPLVPNENRPRGMGPYRPTSNKSTTVLGDEQWKWLETELGKPAEIRLIASSIQVVSDQHGWETWGNFPHERQRLYQLIADTRANGVFFISGDRHLMEISCDDARSNSYPIWDFTSSGLTQKKQEINDPNDFRIGPVVREQNFGLIEIQWRNPTSSSWIHFEGMGKDRKLITRQTIRLRDLQSN